MHKKLIIALAGLTTLLIIWGLVELGREPQAPGQKPAATAAASEDTIPVSQNISEGVDPAEEIAKAKFEKINDRELLSPEFLDVFNRFIFEYSQAPRPELLKNFDRWLEKNYSKEEAARIREIFLKYLDYVDRMQKPGFFSGKETLREQIEKIRRLRREIFGQEVADILFRAEEKSVDYALGVRELQQDKTLDEKTRKERIAELAGNLPPEVKDSVLYKDPRQKFIEEEKEAAVDLESLPPEERAQKIHELRVKHFGPEATERLEKLDVETEQRVQRFNAYESARAAFLSDPASANLTREQQDAKLKELRDRNLNAMEAEEASARDKIGSATEEQIQVWLSALKRQSENQQQEQQQNQQPQ